MAMADRGESRKRPAAAIHNVHPEKLRKGPTPVQFHTPTPQGPDCQAAESVSHDLAPGARCAYLAGRMPMHTGRLRTWNEEEGWGYIWSEVHNCDVFVDGANKGTMLPLCEGDPIIFALNVEEGLPIAVFASSANPHATVEKLLDETEKALRKAEQFVAANCDAEVVDLDAGDPEVASLCKRLADGKLETEIDQVKRSQRRRMFWCS